MRNPTGDKVMWKEADIGKLCSDFRDPSGNSNGSFTPLLQLKKFPDIPVSTREEARESRQHPEEPRFGLIARLDGSFPCVVGKEFPAFPSHLKRGRSPQERQEELQGRATIPSVPQISQSIPGKPV